MAGGNPITCPRCGAARRSDDPSCPACLLDAAAFGGRDRAAERIFEAALDLPAEERAAFVRAESRGDSAVSAAVEMLLAGFEEAGGDERPPAAAPSSFAADPEMPGAVIGHFRLVRRIGEGGMGAVWEAEQTQPIARRVALKLIKLGMDTREVVKRFERERQTLALLNHPGIAQVYEAGATKLGRPFFAMELVEGRPITAYCDEAGLDVEERLTLFRGVCAAVEHAHQKGIIHRDLKASNLLAADGVVKVIDFGVAKATQTVGGTPLFTREAQILGTPAYMSPEQARSSGVDVDTRTDVFALGVVLYELLTGVLPIDSGRFTATSIAEMQRIILEDEPPPPSTRRAALGAADKGRAGAAGPPHVLRGDLDWVVMKAIRKDRDERYPSAAALSEDLRRFLAGEPVSAAPPSLAYKVGKFVRRHRTAVASGALVVAALLAGLVVSLLEVRRANRALAGEGKARAIATLTLADMYTRSGLAAADGGDGTRAELWFANAAVLAAKDPDRLSANRLRACTWRGDAMTAVRAFDTGFEHLRELAWNPRAAALIVQGEKPSLTQVWDLESERLWAPALPFSPTSAVWHPAGEQIALLDKDGGLRVLAYPSGRELARQPAATGGMLSWSPDGRWLAGGDTLWDWRTDERRKLPVSAWRVRFSRDSRRILVHWASLTGVCEVDSPGRFLHEPVPAHDGDSSEFLGDGERYAVGLPGGGLAVRDSRSGEVVATPADPPQAAPDGAPVAVSPDGRFIARNGAGVLDLSGAGPLPFPRHRGSFAAASFSPDGALLASGGYDNRLELWSIHDGRFLGEVGHHHTAVVNAAFSPEGRFVASGEDGLVRVWRLRPAQPVRSLPGWAASLAALSSDGGLVAASGFSNQGGQVAETQAFDVATGLPAGPKLLPGGLLMEAVFGRDRSWMAMAVSTTPDRGNATFEHSGGSGNVQLWNPLEGRRLRDPIPMPSEPRGICLHPDGRWLGVCCAGGEGLEIDLSTGATRVLFNHRKPVNAGATLNNGRCAYSPDGRIFAVWGLFQFVHLWDRSEGRDLVTPFEFDTTTFDLAFHQGVAARAVVASSMRIEFRDLRSGAEAYPAIPYINWPFLTRFSADGELLLTAGGGRAAQVWDWRHGRLACPALPHDETVMGGCFLPGAPWVVTGGHDGRIKFWDRRTGMMVRPPIQRDGWVLDLRVTPDARTLVASGFLRGGVELVDLARAFPAPDLDIEEARLLAEIDADAEIHPGGGLAPTAPQAWLKKWREFRARFPRYPGHNLTE